MNSLDERTVHFSCRRVHVTNLSAMGRLAGVLPFPGVRRVSEPVEIARRCRSFSLINAHFDGFGDPSYNGGRPIVRVFRVLLPIRCARYNDVRLAAPGCRN